MLRDPQQVDKITEKDVEVRKEPKKGRFQVDALEERIAPTCHTNPHGKQVGNCKGGK